MAQTPATSASPVSFTRQADVLVVTIDNPPVNALGVDVRRGLAAAGRHDTVGGRAREGRAGTGPDAAGKHDVRP